VFQNNINVKAACFISGDTSMGESVKFCR